MLLPPTANHDRDRFPSAAPRTLKLVVFPLEALSHIESRTGTFCHGISNTTGVTGLSIEITADGTATAAKLSIHTSAIGNCTALLESQANFCCVHPTFFNVAIIAVAFLGAFELHGLMVIL